MKKQTINLANRIGQRPILAMMDNYEGLPPEVAEEMQRRFYIPGNVLYAKEIEFSGKTYRVGVDIEVLGVGKVYMVNAENVKLYKPYEDDYKLFNPLEDPDFQPAKEKGEE